MGPPSFLATHKSGRRKKGEDEREKSSLGGSIMITLGPGWGEIAEPGEVSVHQIRE